MKNQKIKISILKAWKGIWNSLPLLLGIILLITLLNILVPSSVFNKIFSGNPIIDTFIGSSFGSILAGNPITSYIIGGELLKEGISLFAVTALIVSWVTVGLIQFPAESVLLGRKFAIIRNTSAFILSIIVAIITVMVVNLI